GRTISGRVGCSDLRETSNSQTQQPGANTDDVEQRIDLSVRSRRRRGRFGAPIQAVRAPQPDALETRSPRSEKGPLPVVRDVGSGTGVDAETRDRSMKRQRRGFPKAAAECVGECDRLKPSLDVQ